MIVFVAQTADSIRPKEMPLRPEKQSTGEEGGCRKIFRYAEERRRKKERNTWIYRRSTKLGKGEGGWWWRGEWWQS